MITLEEAIKIVEDYHPSCKVSEYAKDGNMYYFYMIERAKTLMMQKMGFLFGSYLFRVDKNGAPEVVPFEQLSEIDDKIEKKLQKI